MEQLTLIAQALAAVEAAKPVKFGDAIPMTPEQALAWTVYLEVDARDRGHGSQARVEQSISTARSTGIAEEEITAAITAAEDAHRASIDGE